MCETIKAAALARSVGGAHAAAIGATNQSLALLGGAIIGSLGVLAAYLTSGFSAVTGAVALYVLTAASGFAVVQIACRRRSIGGFFGRRFAGMRAASASFHEALGEIPVVPRAALAIIVVQRALQALLIGVTIHAASGAFGLRISFLTQGISLVGGSMGDLIPGQLGAVDGAFALAAPLLGIATAAGVAVAVLVRCVQLAWMTVGIATSSGGRARGAPVRRGDRELSTYPRPRSGARGAAVRTTAVRCAPFAHRASSPDSVRPLVVPPPACLAAFPFAPTPRPVVPATFPFCAPGPRHPLRRLHPVAERARRFPRSPPARTTDFSRSPGAALRASPGTALRSFRAARRLRSGKTLRPGRGATCGDPASARARVRAAPGSRGARLVPRRRRRRPPSALL
jgi:hypothetical protein